MIFERLIAFLAPAWPSMAISVLFSFATVFSHIGLMTTSAYLISYAALHPPLAALTLAIIGVRFFGISRACSRYAERYFSHDAAFRLLCLIRVRFFQALEPQLPAGLPRSSATDHLSRMVFDVETLKFFHLKLLLPASVALLTLGVSIMLLLFYDAYWALVVVTGFIVIGLLMPLLTIASTPVQLSTSKILLYACLSDTIKGLRDASAFDRLSLLTSRFDAAHGAFLSAQRSQWRSDALTESAGQLLIQLTLFFTLILMIPWVRSGQLDGLLFAPLAIAAQTSFEAFTPLLFARRYWKDVRTSAQLLFAVIDHPVAEKQKIPFKISTHPHLCVNRVSYRYTQENGFAVNSFSVDIPFGKRLAIVGPSGSGKSTLITLLAGLREPESGSVLLDNRHINTIETSSLRNAIGAVMQQDHIFNATIAENIQLARPDASRDELWTVLDEVFLGDQIRCLPNGIDTMLGNAGHGLSGGERRRLLLARALLKNPPILLLDEPSAGLNPQLAHQLLGQASPLWNKQRTTLIITHQFIGLEQMDEILVLNKGYVVEQGRFHDLLKNKRLFYKLWTLQQDVFASESKNIYKSHT
jgi:thiol reductant ABC exporter CydC subunit